MRKSWTDEDIQFLKDKWGEMSVSRIAKKMGRTCNSVLAKAVRLKLHCASSYLDGITMNQLANVFGVEYGTTIRKIWMDKLNLPYKTKIIVKKKMYQYIAIDDFWKWAEKNKYSINFSKLEKNILGKEPMWVDEKRRLDYLNMKYKSKNRRWTKEEDQILKSMLLSYRYSYADISKKLNRTECAISFRIQKLNLSERPIQNQKMSRWTRDELNKARQMKAEGYDDNTIANHLNRTAKAVQKRINETRECLK